MSAVLLIHVSVVYFCFPVVLECLLYRHSVMWLFTVLKVKLYIWDICLLEFEFEFLNYLCIQHRRNVTLVVC
jgi:hypothetical protein